MGEKRTKDKIEIIRTDKAGPPVGPYSQGIKAKPEVSMDRGSERR